MNLIQNCLSVKRVLFSLFLISFLVCSNKSFSQRVEDLTDAQVREFVKRVEASGMSETDIEKYALARGYTAADVLKLKERITLLKAPPTKPGGNQENVSEGRTLQNAEKSPNQEARANDNSKDDQTILPKEDYIFGSHLFNGKNLTFEPNLRLATPKNYILGADDELSIDIFGNSQMTYKVKISPEGTVKIENLQPIQVNGLTIDQASDRIINRMKSIYYGLNTQGGGVYAQITLGSIRSIKVTVIGEVTRPGSYTVPSLATVFNVLYQAGGPSKNGSYRNITVIRDNRVIRTMDLYDFLLKADQKDNILVRDQDVIRIADYENRVQIKGEVKRPALFEVTTGETLKSVLGFAGNFTDRAYRKAIKLQRITDKELKLITVNEDKIANFTLNPGDVFEVDSVSNTYENRVQIAGAVYRPGDFAIDENNINTIKDLINAAGGVKLDAFKNRATIVREGKFKEPETISFDLEKLLKSEIEDIKLQKEDSVHINSFEDLHEKYTVTINGQVNKPGVYDYKNKMTVADLVATASGFTEGASSSKIELARRIKKDTLGTSIWQSVKIYAFDIDENLQVNSDDSKYILQPFDFITIKASPRYEVQQNIYVFGEVVYPGEYVVKDREERLADIIKRSGGLRPSAFTKGATIARNKQIISVDFRNAMDNPNSLDNILLIKGDSINIPRKSETVNIIGGVFNPAIVTFNQSAKVKDYISLAGGYDEDALARKVYVTYPNGASAKTKSFLFIRSYPKVEPGSIINVPVVNKDSVQKLTAVEKSSIITAFVSMTGIIFTIVRSIVQ